MVLSPGSKDLNVEKEIGKKLDELLSKLKGKPLVEAPVSKSDSSSVSLNNGGSARVDSDGDWNEIIPESVSDKDFTEIDVSSMKTNKDKENVDFMKPEVVESLKQEYFETRKLDGVKSNDSKVVSSSDLEKKPEGEFDYHKFDRENVKKKHDYMKDLMD